MVGLSATTTHCREPLMTNDTASHEPVADDLSAVQADDKLLDALGSATPGAAGSLVDDELNAILLAWRGEVESVGFGDLVDTDTAVAVIQANKPTVYRTGVGRWIDAFKRVVRRVVAVLTGR